MSANVTLDPVHSVTPCHAPRGPRHAEGPECHAAPAVDVWQLRLYLRGVRRLLRLFSQERHARHLEEVERGLLLLAKDRP